MIPYSQLILSKPLSFYSMFYKINNEDKDKMFQDSLVDKLNSRNIDLEKQSFQMNEDLYHLSQQIKELLRTQQDNKTQIQTLEQVIHYYTIF